MFIGIVLFHVLAMQLFLALFWVYISTMFSFLKKVFCFVFGQRHKKGRTLAEMKVVWGYSYIFGNNFFSEFVIM